MYAIKKDLCDLCGQTGRNGAEWKLQLRARKDGRIAELRVHYPCGRIILQRLKYTPLKEIANEGPAMTNFVSALIFRGVVEQEEIDEGVCLDAIVEGRIFPSKEFRKKKQADNALAGALSKAFKI